MTTTPILNTVGIGLGDHTVRYIEVSSIDVGTRRRAVTPTGVANMTTWLALGGQAMPILVRKGRRGRWIVVAGAHRLAAALALGWLSIRCIVVDVDDVGAELWEIVENLRIPLTPLEQADHIAAWIDLSKQRAISRKVDEKLPPGRPESGTAAASRELGISEPAARRAVRIASLSEEAKAAARETGLDKNRKALLQAASQPKAPEQVKSLRDRAIPGGARALMASRNEHPDSLDFFPTPPWATRTLPELVLPFLRVTLSGSILEPACGEGHMTQVLSEYSDDVIGTDTFDYSGDGRSAPCWVEVIDFLDDNAAPLDADWVITNPPFNRTEAFVLRALALAKVGVAMFVRLQFLETVGRYESIFRDNPPTLIAFFAERVNLCKGRWDPEGSTATAYIWMVWLKGRATQAPFWIPPGCRQKFTRPDDVERFTSHPVLEDLPSPMMAGSELTVPEDDDAIAAKYRLQQAILAEILKEGSSVMAPDFEDPAPANSAPIKPDADAVPLAATQDQPVLETTSNAAAPKASPPAADDFEDIPTFLRVGHPDNAWANRGSGST